MAKKFKVGVIGAGMFGHALGPGENFKNHVSH
jgi:hypothetical protein